MCTHTDIAFSLRCSALTVASNSWMCDDQTTCMVESLRVCPVQSLPTGHTWLKIVSLSRCYREEYYGLRVRQVKDPSIAINIPVNTTIGPSGLPCHPVQLTQQALLLHVSVLNMACPLAPAVTLCPCSPALLLLALHSAPLNRAAKPCLSVACRVSVGVFQEPPKCASLPHREHVQ